MLFVYFLSFLYRNFNLVNIMIRNLNLRSKLYILFSIIAFIFIGFKSIDYGIDYRFDGFHNDEPRYAYWSGLILRLFNLNDLEMFEQSEYKYHAVPHGLYLLASPVFFSSNRNLLVYPDKLWGYSGKDGKPDYSKDITESPLNDNGWPLIIALREGLSVYRLGVFCSLYIFALLVSGIIPAFVSCYYLFQNSFFQEFSNRVLLDIIWIFLLFLMVFLNRLYFISLIKQKRYIGFTLIVLSGGICALISGTKIHGLGTLFGTALIICSQLLFFDVSLKKSIKKSLFDLFFFFTSFSFVFYGFNTVMWKHPIQGTIGLFIARFRTFDFQAMTQPDLALHSVPARWDYITSQMHIHWGVLIVLIAGFLIMSYKSYRHLFLKKEISLTVIMHFYMVMYITATLLFMEMAYPQYLIVFPVFIAILIQYFTLLLISSLNKAVRRKKNEIIETQID